MKIIERKIGRITILKIEGEAVINAHPEALSQLIEGRLEAGERLFVLNYTSCQRMDSTGLGELIKSLKLVANFEGLLKLACVPIRLRGLIVASNLMQILEIYDGEQEAINSFGS